MKNNHIFLDRTELLLEVCVENNAITFKTNDFRGFPYADFHFVFNIETLTALASYLESLAFDLYGSDFKIQEPNPIQTEYHSYYSEEFDDNVFLSVSGNSLKVGGPDETKSTLYVFTKERLATFLFDLKKNNEFMSNFI